MLKRELAPMLKTQRWSLRNCMNDRVFLLNTNENGNPFQNCLIYYLMLMINYCFVFGHVL
jgi:hypothetical protein